MKILLITLFIFLSVFSSYSQKQSKEKHIPDILGYHTLKCDFHMHTIFSDGKVWPTVRVTEALKEGLDAIALTDHIGISKRVKDVNKNLNRAYEIAVQEAENSGLIVIKGAELTYHSPPGHFNALFLRDAQKLDTTDFWYAFEEAKKQGAFLIWNHSIWKAPDSTFIQNGIAEWTNTHTKLFNKGMIMGMEVVNGQKYCIEAHQWCLEKNITMFGNSDIHQPITFDYQDKNRTRPLTLVFAKEKTESAIKEALLQKRTVVWFNNSLIGKEEFLTPLLHSIVSVSDVAYYEDVAEVRLKNNSAFDMILANIGDYSFINRTRIFTLKAGEEFILGVKTGEQLNKFKLKFKILNLLVSTEQSLIGEFECKLGNKKAVGRKAYK